MGSAAHYDIILIDLGVYDVCGKLWTVGSRYQLLEYVGGGSYGDVCKANDLELKRVVAVKRVADILCSPVLAKRILREVCIMRRLSHPFIISLTDVFTKPSLDTDRGLDLYIATEFADRGDMYHLREHLTSNEVRLLMWQLLVGVEYMHSVHVWHRDIKSENVLVTTNGSLMQVKLCDFGLSRSAMEGISAQTELRYDAGNVSTEQSKRKLVRQYTKTVVTPSYRAPEVVMSQGQYSSAIDLWSLGCIFWELLMRQLSPQQAGPPSRPLFGVRGEPATPERGENYADDGHSARAEQLDVIFNVIGTPCWKDIESVPGESWRNYLKHLPGRAGNLVSQLSGCDEEGLDLLSRMLAFDPSRRCTAEEALSHTYFKNLKANRCLPRASLSRAPCAQPKEQFWALRDPATALAVLERELELSVHEKDGGQWKLVQLLRGEVEDQQMRHQVLLLQSKSCCDGNGMMVGYEGGASDEVVQGPVTMQLFPTASLPSMTGDVGGGPALVPAQECMEWQAQWKDDEAVCMRDSESQPKKPRKAAAGKPGSLRIQINNPSTSALPSSPALGRYTRSTAAAYSAAAVDETLQPGHVNSNTISLLPTVQQVANKKSNSQRRSNTNKLAYQGTTFALPRRSPRLKELHSGASSSSGQDAAEPSSHQYSTLRNLIPGHGGLRS